LPNKRPGRNLQMLPRRIPKPAKRATRWRSPAHCNFVRSHACSICGDMAGIEVAHVRLGSGAGVGQKPDDFRTVSLCKHCHGKQHLLGERTFWAGRSVDDLIEAFCKASPKAADIRRIKQERANGN
jgi:hypothetical protein